MINLPYCLKYNLWGRHRPTVHYTIAGPEQLDVSQALGRNKPGSLTVGVFVDLTADRFQLKVLERIFLTEPPSEAVKSLRLYLVYAKINSSFECQASKEDNEKLLLGCSPLRPFTIRPLDHEHTMPAVTFRYGLILELHHIDRGMAVSSFNQKVLSLVSSLCHEKAYTFSTKTYCKVSRFCLRSFEGNSCTQEDHLRQQKTKS